eukprot:6187613-Pleurochrysis_carterae.AAC.9
MSTVEAMTEGYGLTRDTSCLQLATSGGITKIRMFELVARRGQLQDVGGNLTHDVAKPLVHVSCQAFVAFRLANTQRTAVGHAEAEKEKGEIRTLR